MGSASAASTITRTNFIVQILICASATIAMLLHASDNCSAIVRRMPGAGRALGISVAGDGMVCAVFSVTVAMHYLLVNLPCLKAPETPAQHYSFSLPADKKQSSERANTERDQDTAVRIIANHGFSFIVATIEHLAALRDDRFFEF